MNIDTRELAEEYVTEVITSGDAKTGEYRIDRIVDDLYAVNGGWSVDKVDETTFWETVERHSLTDDTDGDEDSKDGPNMTITHEVITESLTLSICESVCLKTAGGDPMLAQFMPMPDEFVEEVKAEVGAAVDAFLAKTGRDAAVKALREAGDALTEANTGRGTAFPTRDALWVRERADRIENGDDQ